MQLHGAGRCSAARNYSPSGARAMRTVTAVPLNATVTSLLAVSPKCREGRRRRRLTCLASRRSPRRRGAAERRRAGPVDSPSKSRRFGRDKELGESAIRNSAGRRSGSRSATTAAPRPSHEIRRSVRRCEPRRSSPEGAHNRALGYLCCPSGTWLSAPRSSIMRTSVPESVAVRTSGIQALNPVAEPGR